MSTHSTVREETLTVRNRTAEADERLRRWRLVLGGDARTAPGTGSRGGTPRWTAP